MRTQISLRDLDFDDKAETVINKSSEWKIEEDICIYHNPKKIDTVADASTILDVRPNFGRTCKKNYIATSFRSGDSISFDDDIVLKKRGRKFFEIKNNSQHKKAWVWYYRPLSPYTKYSVIVGFTVVVIIFFKIIK